MFWVVPDLQVRKQGSVLFTPSLNNLLYGLGVCDELWMGKNHLFDPLRLNTRFEVAGSAISSEQIGSECWKHFPLTLKCIYVPDWDAAIHMCAQVMQVLGLA